MVNAGGRRVRLGMTCAAWLAMWATASCRFDLPELSSADAPEDSPAIDAPPQFSSCIGLAATCGADANASCCQVAIVPGDTFYRGYDGAGHDDMGYPATVSTFVLDKYEVTVGRFREFVNAGMGIQANPPMEGTGTHPNLAGSGWESGWNTSLAVDTDALRSAVKCNSAHQTWTDTPGSNEDRPINCVTWYEAMAFCIWDGGYLPTEAEWNHAASGGSDQRAYPWSNNPASSTNIDCMYANFYVDNPPGMHCVNGTTGGVDRVGSRSSRGDGKWGHSDLAGSIWEWTLDWYDPAYPLPCNDCANLTASERRVDRGGSFADDASYQRTAYRDRGIPGSRYNSIGLRCARTP